VTRIFWLSLRFLGLYALLLAVFALTPLRDITGNLVAATTATILQFASGHVVTWWPAANGIDLSIHVAGPDGTPISRWVELETLEHIRNLPLYFAIVLAAAQVRRRRLLVVLAVGALALIVLDGVILAADAWENVAEAMPFNDAYEVLSLFRVYHATGAAGMFGAPVFIGALVALTTLKGERAGTPAPTTKRNDPCPCGSGVKFKRCCGAA
jgi:SEC-C motif